MRLPLLFVLYYLISLPVCTAQVRKTGWVNGYVVNNTGDTLQGEIDNRDWDTSPIAVRFRSTATEAYRTYATDEIRGFYVQLTNEYYRRVQTDLDQKPTTVSKLERSDNPVFAPAVFLARVLVNGPLSLAMHRSRDGRIHYLISRGTDAWQDLLLIRYLDNTDRIITNDRYQQQLGAATFDCPAISRKLETLRFSETSIASFVMAYNTCQTGRVVATPQYSRQKARVEWGILAGATLTTLTLGIPVNKTYFADQPYHYRGTAQPTAGVWVNYFISRNRAQWSVYNSFQYQHYTVDGTWTGNARELTGIFTYSYLKLHTAFRWQSPGASLVRPFVMVGFSNGLAFSSSQNIRYDHNRNYEQGLIGAAGARTGRVMGEVRYERGNGMSTGGELTTRTETVFLLLSYVF